MKKSQIPDTITMQYDSFEHFFSKSTSSEISFQKIFEDYRKKRASEAVKITKWELGNPIDTPHNCLLANKHYSRELLLYTDDPNWSIPLKVPILAPTPSGEFILASKNGLKAIRYVLIMQLADAPGIHYHENVYRWGKVRTCEIVPILGKRLIMVEKIIKRNITRKIYLGRKEIVENALLCLLKHWGIVGINGKIQMATELKGLCDIDETTGQITEKELTGILELFNQAKLKITDDRSLANRKVMLIGDFLLKIFHHAFVKSVWYYKRKPHYPPHMISEYLLSSIDNLFRRNKLLQLVDDTNPLSEISQKRKLTFFGPGGLNENSLNLYERDVHPTDFGRLCPVESPQGKKIGLNLYLAHNARITKGCIEAQFKDLATGKDIFLNPMDESNKVVAIKINDDVPITDNKIWIKRPTEDVDIAGTDTPTHETISPCSFLGYATCLIPFIQHNDGNRALMGANMMKQAIALKNPAPPLINTGFESILSDLYKENYENSPFIVNGKLCLGTNLLVGYLPWDLLNYEDAIVISDRLVRQNILTHIETEEIIFDEFRQDGEKIYTNHIIEPGEQVTPGRILVKKTTKARPTITNRHLATIRLVALQGGRQNETDASLRAPMGMTGTVESVEIIDNNLPTDVSLRVIIIVKKDCPIQIGDKLTGRHGNKGVVSCILPEREMPYIKSSRSKCADPSCKVIGKHAHLEILLNPLTITGRMNLGQLYETALSWIAESIADQGGITVSPFSREWPWEKIKSALEEKGFSHKHPIFLFKDGKEKPIGYPRESTIAPVTVGYQYIMKLKHLAEKKITARSLSETYNDPATGQPSVPHIPPNSMSSKWQNTRMRKKSAQRLGEMEVWALEGHSAWNIIDECLFLKSDAELDKDNFLEYIQNLGNKFMKLNYRQREHRALKALVYYIRGLGLELEGKDKGGNIVTLVGPGSPKRWPILNGISFRIADDKDRIRWAGQHIIKKTGTTSDGLWSNDLGNYHSQVPAEGLLANDAAGIIELPVPVDNPLFIKKKDNQQTYIEFLNNFQAGDEIPSTYFQKIFVVPKNLRFETEDFTNIKFPNYDNDLNYLYQLIIRKIDEIGTISNLERQKYDILELRDYVHALTVHGKKETNSANALLYRTGNNQPLRSLLACIAGYKNGKEGLFRKHLLGKRVNASGRAVIIPDPDLSLDEAGLPYSMGVILFRELLIREYLEFIKQPDSEVKDHTVLLDEADIFLKKSENQEIVRRWLDKLAKEYLVLLNRAPSLHRLSILAFRPMFYKCGNAIRLNPYVCKPFNADFDGDTMSVHVPLLPSSQKEAANMLPSAVLFSAANGELIISQKADIALGYHILSRTDEGPQKIELLFGVKGEPGKLPTDMKGIFKSCAEKNPSVFEEKLGSFTEMIRLILNDTAISLGLDDFIIDKDLNYFIGKLRKDIVSKSFTNQEQQKDYFHTQIRLITDALKERNGSDLILKKLFDIGAAKGDLMQLIGIRGYQSRPDGGETPQPILSSIFEGLSPLEYFNSCHGSRHGMADKGLTTALAGDLTNILVQAVQDLQIAENDCQSKDGLPVAELKNKDGVNIELTDRITGRFLAEDIQGTKYKSGQLITPAIAGEIIKNKTEIKIRSPIFCKLERGICQKCYGLDLAINDVPPIGYPVGIIAAQSISEPGTQLALKSFHTGGVSGQGIGENLKQTKTILINPMSLYSGLPSHTKPAIAAHMIELLQGIYTGSGTIADHHFEVIIRKMLKNNFIKGILKVALNDQGLLARLGFRETVKILSYLSTSKSFNDDLVGFKERIIAGNILP